MDAGRIEVGRVVLVASCDDRISSSRLSRQGLHNLFNWSKVVGLSKSGEVERLLSVLSISKIVECKFGELSVRLRLVALQTNSGIEADIA